MNTPTTTTEHRRRRYSAEEKLEILTAFEQRTNTQQEFCRERDLCVATLRNWLAKGTGTAEGGFMELPPPRGRGNDDEFCLQMELRDGTVLRIAVGTDPRWLRQLLLALRCGA